MNVGDRLGKHRLTRRLGEEGVPMVITVDFNKSDGAFEKPGR